MPISLETILTPRRFEGYRITPFLWKGMLEGVSMYSTDGFPVEGYPQFDSTAHIRLGKLTEQFVLFELEQDTSIEILQSNIQVFRDQITIGELDCLIKTPESFLHLEIVYKFYLYDPSITEEVHRWIGPNRKDSLIQKLDKLRQKQMPLLYRPETVEVLDNLGLKSADFQQQVYFKAQLFVPYNAMESPLPLINNNCIKGFYIRYKELNLFSDYTFYVPDKLDWLVEPIAEVDWRSLKGFQQLISEQIDQERAPLCWMKSPNGVLQKFFTVWWA